MNRKFLATLPLLLIPVPLGADVLGVQVGGGGWLYDISGTARYQTQDSSNDIDVNDDLGYDDDNLAYLYGVFEHPVPLLPNIRLSYAHRQQRPRCDAQHGGVRRYHHQRQRTGAQSGGTRSNRHHAVLRGR